MGTVKHSLNDTSHLRKLILDNPDLPLLIFCGEDSNTGEFAFEQAQVHAVVVDELTLYKETWIDKDEFRERLSESLCDEEAYQDLSDGAFDQMINEMVGVTEFTKAIIIYVG